MKTTKIAVKLGGQEHTLVYDNYAMMMLDDYLGKSSALVLQDLGANQNFTVKLVAAAVLAGLQHDAQLAAGMDMRKVCSMLPHTGLGGLIEFTLPILEAISKCLGFDEYAKLVPEEERAERPTVSPSETGAESTGENSAS